MLRVGSIVIGVGDVQRAAAFYLAALDYVPVGEVNDAWMMIEPRTGGGQRLSLGLSESPIQDRPRIHLDLYAPAAKEAEVERLIALGASEVDWPLYPEDPDFIVLADTEGNLFCVIDGAAQTPSA